MRGTKQILLFVLLAVLARAQKDTVSLSGASPSSLFKMGKSALKQQDAFSAIMYLEEYRSRKPGDAKGLYLLGKAYMGLRDYDRARAAFLTAYKTNAQEAGPALYYHAQMQKSSGQYDSAKLMFRQFAQEYKGKEKSLKRQARKEIVFCDSITELIKSAPRVEITRLDSSLNKVNAEGSPLLLEDGTLLFSSLRTNQAEFVVEEDYSKIPLKKMYYARNQGGNWVFGGVYEPTDDPDYNIGGAALSADRKRMYFTKCSRNLAGKMICQLYMMERKGQGWTEAIILPREVNHPRYTCMMPAVGTDPVKNNDVLFFVSDRPGGKGGYDIWQSTYDRKKNVFRKARNAGSKVNTPQDELTPFFDNETRSLYFSSDGLGGLGGFDVFVTLGNGRRFTGPRNIGAHINSGADELYFVMGGQRDRGFFVSNRMGGSALPNSTCCDDLYSYLLPDYETITLKGDVMDMIHTDIPVAEANVDIYVKDKNSDERFYVKSVATDSTGSYNVSLEPDQDYFLVIRRKDMLGTTEEVSTRNLTKGTTLKKSVKIIARPKGPVVISGLNYEFGRADLNPIQKKLLDEQLISLMKTNPEIIVEVQSHTDSKGSDQLNQKLSQRRADNIVSYALSKGIEPFRLRAVGYGEKKPLFPNENPDGSDNPVNRAKNRRTEFKIIGIIDTEAPEVYEEIRIEKE